MRVTYERNGVSRITYRDDTEPTHYEVALVHRCQRVGLLYHGTSQRDARTAFDTARRPDALRKKRHVTAMFHAWGVGGTELYRLDREV